MRHLKTSLAVLGAVTVLVLAGNTIALAATGQSFLLGKSNSANNITALTRTTSGSALKLGTASSTNSPLTVNGKGKVTNLNADSVDGYNSTDMRNRTYVFTKHLASASAGFTEAIPLPAGTYFFAYEVFMHSPGTSGNAACQIVRKHESDSTYFGITQQQENGQDPGISGAGVITTTTGDIVNFACVHSSTFSTQVDAPAQIVFSPTTVVGGGPL